MCVHVCVWAEREMKRPDSGSVLKMSVEWIQNLLKIDNISKNHLKIFLHILISNFIALSKNIFPVILIF